ALRYALCPDGHHPARTGVYRNLRCCAPARQSAAERWDLPHHACPGPGQEWAHYDPVSPDWYPAARVDVRPDADWRTPGAMSPHATGDDRYTAAWSHPASARRCVAARACRRAFVPPYVPRDSQFLTVLRCPGYPAIKLFSGATGDPITAVAVQSPSGLRL